MVRSNDFNLSVLLIFNFRFINFKTCSMIRISHVTSIGTYNKSNLLKVMKYLWPFQKAVGNGIQMSVYTKSMTPELRQEPKFLMFL